MDSPIFVIAIGVIVLLIIRAGALADRTTASTSSVSAAGDASKPCRMILL